MFVRVMAMKVVEAAWLGLVRACCFVLLLTPSFLMALEQAPSDGLYLSGGLSIGGVSAYELYSGSVLDVRKNPSLNLALTETYVVDSRRYMGSEAGRIFGLSIRHWLSGCRALELELAYARNEDRGSMPGRTVMDNHHYIGMLNGMLGTGRGGLTLYLGAGLGVIGIAASGYYDAYMELAASGVIPVGSHAGISNAPTEVHFKNISALAFGWQLFSGLEVAMGDFSVGAVVRYAGSPYSISYKAPSIGSVAAVMEVQIPSGAGVVDDPSGILGGADTITGDFFSSGRAVPSGPLLVGKVLSLATVQLRVGYSINIF